MSGIDGHTHFALPPPAATVEGQSDASFAAWRQGVVAAVQAAVDQFVAQRCFEHLDGAGVGLRAAADVLRDFLAGGKCLRSTFSYLGWRCGAGDDDAALRAAASFELLHAFALLQDDVMDGSALRRGKPSAHVVFAQWHRDRELAGSPERFGESAAVLLGDLCLVWAEHMLRDSGVDADALARAWPRYDTMRSELAVGQFADLVNDAGAFPTLEQVLDVSRRKSGNYTVRRPLEIGAAMAGCGAAVLESLGSYGEAVGDAFQMRDDVLGIFGSPTVTGKPAGVDLLDRKATSVVVAAYELADTAQRGALKELMSRDDLDESGVERWRDLIVATGAVEWVDEMIDARLQCALASIDAAGIDASVRMTLARMASACADRAA